MEMKNNHKRQSVIGLCIIALLLFFYMPTTAVTNVRNFNQPKLQWWQQARFGMFIHWGPVTLTGNDISWSRNKYDVSKYDSLYLRFNPIKYDAKKWVEIAQSAGMKYMVLIAKHHDGFCEWNTKTTDYNIMKTPYGKDVCKQLADAAHKAGMRIGWYFSPADWKDPDCRDEKNNPRFVKRVLEQIRELLTNYGKIDMLWIDYEGGPSPVKPNLIYQLANKLQPGIIINNRLDVLHTDESHSYIGPNGDYATPEGFVAGYGAIPWETCTNLGHQWAWKFNDKPRPITEAATTLLRCVGGNGNLLLNVGPDSLGQIPAEFEKSLRDLGKWIKPIGRSIYGTKGGPYSPTQNMTCTYNGKSVYIHILKADRDTITLPPMPIKILNARVINSSPVKLYQTRKDLKLVLPAAQRTEIATTIELTLSKSAEAAGIIRPFSTTGSLAYNKKVTASSSVGQFLHDAAAAVDDNPNTFWTLGRKSYINCDKYFGSKLHYVRSRQELRNIFCTSGWLEVDLGKAQTVGRVKVIERIMFNSAIQGFEIQYKKGNQWITWAKDTKMGNWEKELTPVKARYFRLIILDRDYMSGIKEFQLFPPSK
jgi:alpha-L-fucosidase